MTEKDKLFSRTEYRRVIAWPERIRREAPFFAETFADAPSRAILDVGCGTGEHARHFAEQGWHVVGIDISEKMIDDAQDHAGPASPASASPAAAPGSARFELLDAADAAGLPEAPFGAALCIGNGMAFVEGEEQLHRFLRGIAAALRPGAPFLLQMLNYERILGKPVRALGVNVCPRPEDEGDGDIVFLRVFRPRADDDTAVDFYPITLTLTPGADPPVELRSAREGVHQAWKRPQVEKAFADTGFTDIRVLGGMGNVPYETLESPDLVMIARRKA